MFETYNKYIKEYPEINELYDKLEFSNKKI